MPSTRRAELWHDLNDGVDPAKSAEADELSERIDELWAEARAPARARPLRPVRRDPRPRAGRRAARARLAAAQGRLDGRHLEKAAQAAFSSAGAMRSAASGMR